MKFQIANYNVLKQKTDCLILPIWKGKTQSKTIKDFDILTNNQINNLIKAGDFKADLSETITLYHPTNVLAQKVLLVGLGDKKDFSPHSVKSITESIAKHLLCLNSKNIIVSLANTNKTEYYTFIRMFIETLSAHCYQFNEYKTVKSPAIMTENITLVIDNQKSLKSAELGLQHGQAIANAVNTTRTLSNQPPNICNAQFLANSAKQLNNEFTTLVPSFYDEAALRKLKMHAYLSVGQGSKNESIMTVINYQGSNDEKMKPIVLVGKGLTFDSGGISIKPAAGMDEMKYDMCGAATVFGVMQAIAELKLPINVIGIMAGCENMPGGDAYRPGDILTTMSGKTVEVINTDAEGRLVLCDVLTFAERFNPEAVIDIATLTGACIVALGHHYTGVMGNDNELVGQLISASTESHDKAWSLPLDDDFQKQIKSTCADIVNSAGRDGGTITAGCFLSQFTKNYHWAHLDIAGTAWVSGAKKGATGRPVSMLVQFLINKSS